MIKFLQFFPTPQKSKIKPKPKTVENQLCPLGLPYQTGQQNPIFFILEFVQKGLGSQSAAFKTPARYVFKRIKTRKVKALPFLLLRPIIMTVMSRTIDGSMIMVMMRKNQSKNTDQRLCRWQMMLSPFSYRGHLKKQFRIKVRKAPSRTKQVMSFDWLLYFIQYFIEIQLCEETFKIIYHRIIMDVGVEKPSNGLLLFTTALAGSLFFGEVGAFAMIKYPLSQEFGFKQSYLGLLDTMRQLGNLVGLILFLLFPPHRPKQIFFFFNTAECLMIMVLFLGKSMGDSQQIIFLVLMFFIGTTKAVVFVPSLIVYQNIDPSQKFVLGVWNSMLTLGDLFSVMLGQLILNQAQWNWKAYTLIFVVLLFFSGLLFYCVLEEVQISENEQTVGEKFRYIKYTLSKPNRFAVIFQFVFFSVFYYNMMLWFPYYFTANSYENYSSYLSIILPLFSIVGTLVFQSLIRYCTSKSHWIISTILGLVAAFQFFMTQLQSSQVQKNEKIILYFVLVTLICLLLSGPYSRISTSQMVIEGDRTEKMNYYMLATFNLFRCLMSIICLYMIGYFLEQNTSSFFWILLINIIVLFIIDVIRNIFLNRGQLSNQIAQQEEQVNEEQ